MPIIKTQKADLRAKYGIYLKIAIIISLLLLNAAFMFFPHFDKNEIITDNPQEIIKIEEVINTVQKHQKPKLPERPKIFVKDEDLPDDPELPDVSINYDEKLDKPPDLLDRNNVYKDEPFIEWAPTMPEPIGGLKAIREKVVYTEIAKRMGLEGKVIIEAWVDEHGNVKDAIVVRDIGGGLGDAAVNAILATKFFPGKQGSTPVKIKMKIPIVFKLR